MLGFQKKWYKKAFRISVKIRDNGSDLKHLIDFQKFIISRITFCERHSPKIKDRIKHLDKMNLAGTDLHARLQDRLEQYRQASYLWRCFGDMIAFSFMDSFSLKQVFYNTHNENPKQSSGFIGGKEGLNAELNALSFFAKRGLPALLTDLTNTIRHGDICLMIGPDPHLIEIKTSKKKDKRGKKQDRRISELMNFFATDHANTLRAFQNIRRRASPSKTVYHTKSFTNCLRRGLQSGHHVENPEDGVYYLAISDPKLNPRNIFQDVKAKEPWIFSLNEIKNSKNWAPYVPFTKTIDDIDALWSFIKGKVVAFVLFDVDQIRVLADKSGFDCLFDNSVEDFPLQFVRRSDGAQVRGSTHVVSRIGIEMLSLKWFVDTMIDTFQVENE